MICGTHSGGNLIHCSCVGVLWLANYSPATWRPLRMLHTVLLPLLTQCIGIMSGWATTRSPRPLYSRRTQIKGSMTFSKLGLLQ